MAGDAPDRTDRMALVRDQSDRALDIIERLPPERSMIVRSEDLFVVETGVANDVLAHAGARRIRLRGRSVVC